MATPAEQCADSRCDQPPQMAIATSRMKNGGIKTTIFFDIEDATAKASQYCKGHGRTLASGLIYTLVTDDLPPEGRS